MTYDELPENIRKLLVNFPQYTTFIYQKSKNDVRLKGNFDAVMPPLKLGDNSEMFGNYGANYSILHFPEEPMIDFY